MKTAISICAVIACVSFAVAQDAVRNRPMDQMHGGCDNYAVDLKTEMQLMSTNAAEASAADVAGEAPPIQTSKALLVALRPQSQVHFAVPPAQDRGGPEKRAGLLLLSTLSPRDWRVWRIGLRGST